MAIEDSKKVSDSSEGRKEINNQSICQRNEKVKVVLRPNTVKWRGISQQVRAVGNSHYESEPVNLEKGIQKKVLGIVEKKDFPVGLYEKAAAAAEAKEEGFKQKTASLMTQVHKGEDLRKLLKRVN